MPKVLEDRVKAIGRNNPKLPESNRWAIATAALQKEGKLPHKKYEGGGMVKTGSPAVSAPCRDSKTLQCR